MKTIAVYCGSSSGHDPAYIQAAKDVGALLVEQGIDLVYGGGSVGMMGAVADAVLRGGGKVTGIIPTFLDSRELGHHGVTELIVVDTMHERKIKMFDMADGFIALPGGLGTMEELFEVLAWSQLAIHRHPCGLLNVRGYYDGLLLQLRHMVSEGLLRGEDRSRLIASENASELLEAMRYWNPPVTGKYGLGEQGTDKL
ncbi:MAG: TIGR00730 family Rossman fold protein [Verrucomicrobiae bacterium]|nr:TIGR00730 family Rossman fold protein [Verrucomicrobiae bacterium]